LTQVAAITGEISTCQRRFQNTKEDQVISWRTHQSQKPVFSSLDWWVKTWESKA
jgi:hypothetical protein